MIAVRTPRTGGETLALARNLNGLAPACRARGERWVPNEGVSALLAMAARLEREAAELRHLASLMADAPVAEPAAEVWLTPGQIAERIGVGERYVTKLLACGLSAGHPGVRKPAGRWAATMAAVRDLRAV